MTEEEINTKTKLDILKRAVDYLLTFTQERMVKKITQMDNELAKINTRLDNLENKKDKPKEGLARLG